MSLCPGKTQINPDRRRSAVLPGDQPRLFPCAAGRSGRWEYGNRRLCDFHVSGAGQRGHYGSATFREIFARLSLLIDHVGTVLAVKGSLRRAQQRRALDSSGPFRRTDPDMRERLIVESPAQRDQLTAILAPFSTATDISKRSWERWKACRWLSTVSTTRHFHGPSL